MTQAALQFDAHTLLLGLLGMVCGFLAYWDDEFTPEN